MLRSFAISEMLNPFFTRIELFARQTTRGWDYWGNETKKFNEVKNGKL